MRAPVVPGRGARTARRPPNPFTRKAEGSWLLPHKSRRVSYYLPAHSNIRPGGVQDRAQLSSLTAGDQRPRPRHRCHQAPPHLGFSCESRTGLATHARSPIAQDGNWAPNRNALLSSGQARTKAVIGRTVERERSANVVARRFERHDHAISKRALARDLSRVADSEAAPVRMITIDRWQRIAALIALGESRRPGT
jgi:hypothetical protein